MIFDILLAYGLFPLAAVYAVLNVKSKSSVNDHTATAVALAVIAGLFTGLLYLENVIVAAFPGVAAAPFPVTLFSALLPASLSYLYIIVAIIATFALYGVGWVIGTVGEWVAQKMD